MTYVGKDTTSIRDSKTNDIINKVYISYKCPKPNCSKGIVRFANKTGFKNPYRHLRSCYGQVLPISEQDRKIVAKYVEARQKATNTGGTIRSHFDIYALSEYEQAISSYISLIMRRSLPMALVEDSQFRQFCRFGVHLSVTTAVRTIQRLVEVVEKRIATEMKQTKGSLMFDGWTCAGVHYVAGIASYCAKVDSGTVVAPRLTVLAVSPMGRIQDDYKYKNDKNVDYDGETTQFDAETHLSFFRKTFEFYKLSFDSWVTCFMCDNAAVNKKMARLAKKPAVTCNSHKLNLQVNEMIKTDAALFAVIEEVQATMKSARKLKNAALLRNLTDYRPVLNNETRWSGVRRMIDRFVKIWHELVDVANSSDGDLVFNTHPSFYERVKKYASMLGEIDEVTKSLQTRGRTLAECRDDISELVLAVDEQGGDEAAQLFNCMLGTSSISQDADLVKDPHFERGVIKLQKGEKDKLTRHEKKAVSGLLKSDVEVRTDSTPTENPTMRSMKERLKKRKVEVAERSKYIDCSFILGSVAEVERLWSTASYILFTHRQRLTPQLFEALIFLKLNERFWDERTVADAYKSLAETSNE